LICAIFSSFVCRAQQTANVQIIPEPKLLTATNENFRLKSGNGISSTNSKSEADRFAARDFIADIKQTAGVELKIGGGNITIGLLESVRIRKEFEKSRTRHTGSDVNAEGYALIV
jgi:hypothetical protein